MSKHTSGPWGTCNPDCDCGQVNSTHMPICTMAEVNTEVQVPVGEEKKANARLIAAAPEMFSYLDRMARGISVPVEAIQSLLNRIEP